MVIQSLGSRDTGKSFIFSIIIIIIFSFKFDNYYWTLHYCYNCSLFMVHLVKLVIIIIFFITVMRTVCYYC